MRSNDPGDDPGIFAHAHNRLISFPLDSYPEQSGHDMYSAFFSSFPDPIGGMSVAVSPYSSFVGGPMDMSMSLQKTFIQIDTADTHIRDVLSESNAPEQQRPPSPPPQLNNASFLQSNSHPHTMLPPMIQPNPNNPSIQFDSETRTFNQRITNTGNSQTDPYASTFLRAQLGPEKFNIFSARLSERRVGAQTSKLRAPPSHHSDQKVTGATAIDFLVKVEVVKEILRTYVPHPYNPLKSLTHLFEGSPQGSVTLTRSTVLILSGWSNTQFSYWARRAEAISVLGQYDERLLGVGTALKRRLHGATTDPPENHLDVQNITGKGLDVIIDNVKKRTGVSQFLRGKHSSLDPFGSARMDGEFGVDVDAGVIGEGMESVTRTVVFSATFQAVAYEHSPPPPAHPPSGAVQQRRGRGKRGRGKGAGRECRGGGNSEAEAQQIAFVSDKHGLPPEHPTASASIPSTSACREHPSATVDFYNNHDQGVQIPMSDSRSELELADGLRKRKLVSGNVIGGKRLRASGL